MSNALASKITKMDTGRLSIAMEVLNEVFVEFQETKKFIDEKLEHTCSKENTSLEEVTYFSLTRQANIFCCAVPGFNEGTFFIGRALFNMLR